MRNGIIAAGNWIIDHTKLIDTFPEEESLANILEEDRGNGGGPYNLVKDLRLMGAEFPLAGIGRVGDDEDGRYILRECETLNVQSAGILTAPDASTSYTDVMSVKSTGRRTFFHHRGANALLEESDFTFNASNHRLFYLGYLMLLDSLDQVEEDRRTGASKVLKKASEAGLETVVDLVSASSDRFREIVRPALQFTDYLLCNDLEAETLSGETVRTGDEIHPPALIAAGENLLKLGVKQLVIIHFPEGAFAMGPDGQHHWQGSVRVPDTKIAGTAGAGDAFAAGLLYGIHESFALQHSLELGVCVAASSLFDPKTSTAVKPVKECMAVGKHYGYRDISSE